MDWSKVLLIVVVTVALWFVYKRLPQRMRLTHEPIRTVVTDRNITSSSGPYPKDFLDSQFPSQEDKEAQRYKDRYIGTFMNAGVIYDKKFLDKQNAPSIKEPASFTKYGQDYMHNVETPERKPFPSY